MVSLNCMWKPLDHSVIMTPQDRGKEMQKCALTGGMKWGDVEQHRLFGCLGQGKRGGKGPGPGQKEQHPWDCGQGSRNGLRASREGAGLCLLAAVAKLLRG